MEGVLKKGTPLCCIVNKLKRYRTSIQFDHKEKDDAKKGNKVCIKIEQSRGKGSVIDNFR